MILLEAFYFSKEEPIKSCLLFLRDCILKKDENITETTKYGMPCFCFKNKAFVYLWTDKKSGNPYILFMDGNKLNHPKLIQGDRKRMKTYNINPEEDINLNELNEVLELGLSLYQTNLQ